MADISSMYPDSWDEYIGQADAKFELQVAVASAKKRGQNLGHILITSPLPGVGKTALAELVARAMGRPIIERGGAMTPSDVELMFSECEPGDIVLYDEIHKAVDRGKANAEWMLKYLEQGVLVTPYGPVEVPAVTIIGATTDKDLLPAPVLQRFKLVELEPYTTDQAAQIAQGMGRKILSPQGLPELSWDVAKLIAQAASSQPRLMRKILFSLRDLVITDHVQVAVGGSYDLELALKFSGLTWDGLPKDAQKYLVICYKEMRNQPVGAALMRERLGIVGRGLEMIEALLLDKELIFKTKQGRKLTPSGLKRAKLLADTGQ